jgi:antitoxin ParD1/3/4
MPTRNISITAAQDRFIDEVVRSGEYQNASEAIRDAVRALQQRRAEDALRLERLRAHIDVGIAALDRGDFIELDASSSKAFFEELLNEPLEGDRR